MNEHADLELIAAFREGVLDPAAGDRVGRHLVGCALCAQRQAALDEVKVRLAQAPPPPLPPVLARRLDAALAAEVAFAETPAGTVNAFGEQGQQTVRNGHRVTPSRTGRERMDAEHARRGPAGRESAGRGPAGPQRAGRQRADRGLMAITLRPLAAVASVCVLAGGGYLLARSLTHTSPVASSAIPSQGKLPAGESATARSPSRQLYAQQVPGAQASVALVHSGTSYQPGQLRAQAAVVASRYAGKTASLGKAGNTTVPPFGINPSLAGCLRRVKADQGRLVVDMATYQGHQAKVIISPGSGGAAGHVWVVGPGCSASNGDIIADSGL